MKSVNKTHSLSGHLQLFAVPLYNIFSLAGQTLTLKNSKDVYELGCARDSLQITLPSESSKHGTSYRPKISGFIPGRTFENDLILEEMSSMRFMVILKNSDGNFTRIGETTLGLTFEFDYNTSPDPSGTSGYSFAFFGALHTGQRPVLWPFLVN
jgi:hypothetical protein